uniref:Serine protease K12H4.7 n=1 Tax=Heliothis virescens TaxID=7102 RepID=A0A2A4JNU2_HELVI
MRLHFLLICLILILSNVAYGGKQFRLGRSKGGNLGAPGGYSGEQLPPAQWFIQKLDHSSPSDLRTWKQRYFVNDSFYDFKNQGPVFLMIGGEGPADARWMVKGAWIDYAKKFNALCINLEHRYYGESHPTIDISVKNLQYLSSYQALADLANFINAMNNKYRLRNDVRWIAFGGSYPGSLAAWLRLKYPHLVYAAVSSSGPLLAKVNFMEYYEVVVDALREKTGGEDCVNELKMAHNQITDMMKTHPSVVEKEFRVCKSFNTASENDIKNFYNSIADDFADLVQYNEDNRISADTKYRNLTINTVCNMLTSPGSEPAYKKLAAFNSIVLDKSNQTCLDYSYDNMIKELRNMSWGSEGDFVAASADWTNSNYGALDISVSRVVFVHGSVDPWHALGITETQDKDAPAIYIKGTAHCANMYPPSENDSSNLIEARVEIEQYLSGWIGQP